MKIVFMGTPSFAVSSLDVMYEKGYDIALVVSQEDKARDRGKKIQMTPVKERALELGIEVFQPKSIKSDESYERLKLINPDIIVVTAYGQIIPKRILELPKYGCVNVHASLLPKYRGAAPIQYALLNGDDVTGITTMYMAEGLDTGDMILKSSVDINEDDTFTTLSEKLADLSKEVLSSTLEKIKSEDAPREVQDEKEATYTGLIPKEMGKIDFSDDAKTIVNKVRALELWPTAYANFNDKKIKFFDVKLGREIDSKDFGKIISITKEYIEIISKTSTIRVYSIQLEGKKRMKVSEYMNGNSLNIKENLIFS